MNAAIVHRTLLGHEISRASGPSAHFSQSITSRAQMQTNCPSRALEAVVSVRCSPARLLPTRSGPLKASLPQPHSARSVYCPTRHSCRHRKGILQARAFNCLLSSRPIQKTCKPEGDECVQEGGGVKWHDHDFVMAPAPQSPEVYTHSSNICILTEEQVSYHSKK